MLSTFKLASKIVKNLNLYNAEIFLNPDWLNLVLADLSIMAVFFPYWPSFELYLRDLNCIKLTNWSNSRLIL